MPKGGKKGIRNSNVDIVADIKLSDFADASARKGRIKKSIGNLNKDKVQDIREEETLWFEKDLEDFQLLGIKGEDSKKQLKPKANTEDCPDRPGIRYPPDLWYLIGSYIRPEQVKLFAGICKDSYCVSRSYSFWIQLYKRHIDSSAQLPPRLQPECIEQAFWLKASVVRSLFHTYPPFTLRPPRAEVGRLAGLRCALMWWLPGQGGRWLFHFKFASASGVPAPGHGTAVRRLWAGQPQEAVHLNPDEGCRLLRFACSHFVAVPPAILGSRLATARAGLASDMRRHRLQLSFSTHGQQELVEFDAVENMVVLEWWHPQYPFDYF